MASTSDPALPKRVLVTGGHGFIGRYVVTRLAALGTEVLCPYRPGTRTTPVLPAEEVELDLLDVGGLSSLMGRSDAVVHLAARSGGIQFQEGAQADVFLENQQLTRAILQCARRGGVSRVFLASSAVVYSSAAGELIPEEGPLLKPGEDRILGYAWAKLTDEVMATWYADEGAFEVVSGRFTNVYGPGGTFDPDRSTVVHSLVRKAVDAGPGGTMVVWGDGRAVRSFIHVEDAAEAVVTVLRAGRNRTAYNIDASRPTTIAELATTIRDAVDPSIQLRFDTTRPQGVPRRVLDNGRLRRLGFSPSVGLDQGVRSTVAAYRALGGRSSSGSPPVAPRP